MSFNFAFVTDPQIGMNSPWGLNGPASDRSRLEWAINFINEPANEIDFTIFGGDLVNNRDAEEELDVLLECLGILEKPYYGVPGNHDLFDPREQPSPYIERGAPVGFSFSHKGAAFLGLNSIHLRGDFGGQLQQQELQHTAEQLDSMDPECSHRFVVTHWPLFVHEPDEAETYWNMENRRRVIALFQQHKVSCQISGHWHQDIDAVWHGISLLGSIGLSKPLQYPEERSFKVVTVFDDGWLARRVSVENV